MISLFEKNLKRMQQELTDLKTVHQRGLGTIRFFQYEVSGTISQTSSYVIRADIVPGEIQHPFIQATVVSNNINTEPVSSFNYESNENNIQISVIYNMLSVPFSTTIRVTSTSQLRNIRLEVL